MRWSAGTDRRDSVDADQRWDLLLVSIAGYMLTSVGRIHQLFPQLELLHPAVVTGIAAIALYLHDSNDERRAADLMTPTTKLLAALLFWMCLAVPLALRPGNSFMVVFDNFVKTALMSFVTAAAVRGIRDVERLAFTYFTAAVVYAAVAIVRFNIGSGDDWRFGHLYYYDSNDFATFAVTAMPLGLYFLHAARRRTTSIAAAAGLVVLVLGFVRSGSRGGFVALALVAVFVVLRYTAIPVRGRAGAMVLIGLALVLSASDQYWRQMSTILADTDYNHTDESGRLQIWRRGIGYMIDQPLLGVGPGNFQVAEGTLSPFAERQRFGIGVRWNAPHNTFIQIGSEAGVPGLLLFVAMLASAFVALARTNCWEQLAAQRLDGSQMTPALTAALLGFVAGSIFLSLAYSEMLYTLLALALGMHKVVARQVNRLEPSL